MFLSSWAIINQQDFQSIPHPSGVSILCSLSFDLNFVLYYIVLHNQALLVGHLLTNFVEFADIRGQCCSLNTQEQVPTVGNYTCILSFLRGVNHYKNI